MHKLSRRKWVAGLLGTAAVSAASRPEGALVDGHVELIASDKARHAMKVTEHGKAQGAILGKAMSELKTGKGMVLVLVTLQ
jgi:hypothetical protein